jgi:hypothetical protein
MANNIDEMIPPPCRQCGKLISLSSFVKSGGRRKFCSRTCAYAGRAVSAIERHGKKCAHCNKLFRPKSFEKTLYCGRACCIAGNKAKPKQRFISDGANKRDYCSSHCLHVMNNTGHEKSCRACGVMFTPVRSQDGKKGMAPYDLPTTCSRECHDAAYPVSEEMRRRMSERISGAGHPNWQGGSYRQGFRGRDWPAIAERARVRAQRKCERCGRPESENGRRLDVNHKIPFHQHRIKEQANHHSNLEALCRGCHTKTDWQWRKSNHIQLAMSFK